MVTEDDKKQPEKDGCSRLYEIINRILNFKQGNPELRKSLCFIKPVQQH